MDENLIKESNRQCEARRVEIDTILKKVDRVEQKVDGQHDILTYLKTVIDFMTEDKKEQKEFNEKQLSALDEITKTQIETQGALKQITSDVDNVKSEISVMKEEQKIAENRGKIDTITLFSNGIKVFVGSAIGGALIGGIIYFINQ